MVDHQAPKPKPIDILVALDPSTHEELRFTDGLAGADKISDFYDKVDKWREKGALVDDAALKDAESAWKFLAQLRASETSDLFSWLNGIGPDLFGWVYGQVKYAKDIETEAVERHWAGQDCVFGRSERPVSTSAEVAIHLQDLLDENYSTAYAAIMNSLTSSASMCVTYAMRNGVQLDEIKEHLVSDFEGFAQGLANVFNEFTRKAEAAQSYHELEEAYESTFLDNRSPLIGLINDLEHLARQFADLESFGKYVENKSAKGAQGPS